MKKQLSVFLILCLMLICCMSPLAAHAAQAFPYRVQIDWADTPIFNGPGYEFDHVDDVGAAGVYTIVQEVWDIEGYVWGELKSGAGWVNLSDITAVSKSVPYIQRVSNENQPIYDGAGYSHKQVGTVEKAANYTITEERYDADGNLWGKLKSGAGWIDLTDVLIEEWDFVPYLLYIADPDTLIYAGADYRDTVVGTVEEAGQYTIVAEHWDSNGALWGKLKSGKGWINLDELLSDGYEFTSYVTYISAPDTLIYAEADDHAAVTGTVEEAGYYTIVSETRDGWGRLWGKLKSGKGWINLGGGHSPNEPVNFRQYIRRADQPIFGGSSYDALYVGTIGESGTYTIVAEADDGEGNVWGLLKSGRGWVDLTDIWNDEANPSPVSATYADENLLLHAGAETYVGADEEIATYVAFRVYEDVSDVALTALVWDYEGFEVDQILHTIVRLEVGQPFVAALPFYGDMTAYGLSFTDSEGNEHFYSVTLSLRNGMIEFNEYVP